jgi:hypothetical protein
MTGSYNRLTSPYSWTHVGDLLNTISSAIAGLHLAMCRPTAIMMALGRYKMRRDTEDEIRKKVREH